jgi:hypothetical protein
LSTRALEAELSAVGASADLPVEGKQAPPLVARLVSAMIRPRRGHAARRPTRSPKMVLENRIDVLSNQIANVLGRGSLHAEATLPQDQLFEMLGGELAAHLIEVAGLDVRRAPLGAPASHELHWQLPAGGPPQRQWFNLVDASGQPTMM